MIRLILLPIVLLCFACNCAQADLIELDEFVGIPSHISGSGNGTLDLRIATFSGSEIKNESGTFNADNGNNTLPQGGGTDTSSFAESYVVSGIEIKDFFRLNFPNGSGGSDVNQLAIFLDLNETGATAQLTNHFTLLDIVLNPTTINGNPDPSGDVTSAEQAAINQVYTGGSLIANMSDSFVNLPTNNQGAGFADYGILIGIDPFSLADNDVVLFNFSMDILNNGAEELFLSGEFSSQDIADATMVPEPGAAGMFASILCGLFFRRRRGLMIE